MTTWVVVADASRARIFESSRQGRNLVECDTLVHPGSRMKTGELMSDSEGTRTDRVGQGQRKADPRTSPHDVEADKFALRLAEYLDEHRNRHDFDDVVLAAPAPFLGLLRDRCGKQVAQMISHTLVKDYTRLPSQEVSKHLQEALTLH